MYYVIYDGNCNLCVTLVQLLEHLDQGRRFQYAPMQDEVSLQSLHITAADCELGMLLIDRTQSQRRWQGSAAAEEIGRLLPLGQLFVEAYRALPGAKATGDSLYSFVRDHRYQLFGMRSHSYRSHYPYCSSDSCQL